MTGPSRPTPRIPRRADLPPEERAREICLSALERRMRSRFELDQILRRKGVPAEVGDPVLERLTAAGLVDDAAFARAFVESRQRSRPRGKRGLSAELRKKGIAPAVIELVLAEREEAENPVEEARRAVAAKLRSLAGKPPALVRQRAEQFLLRRGFDYETIREALRGLDPE
jgi:regulatory protein